MRACAAAICGQSVSKAARPASVMRTRTARLSAQSSYSIGVYTLLARMGLLTVDHLNLGIPTYDPEAYYNAVKTAPATSSQGKKLDAILDKIGN